MPQVPFEVTRSIIDERHVCIGRVALAGKVGEALNALRLAAAVWPKETVREEAWHAFERLHASREDSNEVCVQEWRAA